MRLRWGVRVHVVWAAIYLLVAFSLSNKHTVRAFLKCDNHGTCQVADGHCGMVGCGDTDHDCHWSHCRNTNMQVVNPPAGFAHCWNAVCSSTNAPFVDNERRWNGGYPYEWQQYEGDLWGGYSVNDLAACFTWRAGDNNYVPCRAKCEAGKFRDGGLKPLVFGGECYNCAEGTYSNAGATGCTNCPRGEWSSSGSSGCYKQSCGYGYTVNYAGDDCDQCPEGQSSWGGTSNCYACDAGKYEQNRICHNCEAGKSQIKKGQRFCDNCDKGTYAGSGQTVCLQCPAGKYTALLQSESCQSCEIGKYQDVMGQIECKPCEHGTFSRQPGCISVNCCEYCAEGTYMKETEVVCTHCPDSWYKDASMKSDNECQKCPPGKYIEDGCAGNPLNCDDDDDCKNCPAGAFLQNDDTDPNSAANCQPCIGNTVWNIDKCVACEVPEIPNSAHTQCTNESYFLQCYFDATSDTEECDCSTLGDGIGLDPDNVGHCHRCESGYYANNITTDAANTRNSQRGGVGFTECRPCARGTYSDQEMASTACLACSEGKYSEFDAVSTCTLCDQGKYANQETCNEYGWHIISNITS